MTVTAKCLVEGTLATAAQTTLYTAPAATRTIIDKFTGTNTSGAPVLLTVNLVASGGGAGALNATASKSIAANDSYTFPEIAGHVLNAGDFISVLAASGGAISVRASGREVN